MNTTERKTAIRKLRDEGKTYRAIGKILNIDYTYAWSVINRPLEPHPRKRLADLPVVTTHNMSSGRRGAESEALVAARLLTEGFDVWMPTMPSHRSDMGVVTGNQLTRLQVKTATYDKKTRRFRCTLMTKRKGRHLQYQIQDFDFFVLRCPEVNAFYVIPVEDGIRMGYVNLYPQREMLMDRGNETEKYRDRFDLLWAV